MSLTSALKGLSRSLFVYWPIHAPVMGVTRFAHLMRESWVQFPDEELWGSSLRFIFLGQLWRPMRSQRVVGVESRCDRARALEN
ncbi:uncharacterized protein LACBIDRAFT_312562 [Laccaria bicolor S238N-H82]|uniref:Predicted protein n=1 Tax=Laccaria bicolor (strain S238N-H82 / ATCC MYA-4686) TaxID=486041 RepID=B0DWE5_LACBS|nr:uncharacterized protein LACBIDRAFT_312562 [Laccaria bicolor S238N-H82]EDR01033.1 predicted protein [Laccaria bicolor S238N-H82]|eukprot:XP_001888252.1 predicted protein [Laccaria bicolor S238N-H82]